MTDAKVRGAPWRPSSDHYTIGAFAALQEIRTLEIDKKTSEEDCWRPWRESNPHLGLRSALLCPLSYRGVRGALYRRHVGH